MDHLEEERNLVYCRARSSMVVLLGWLALALRRDDILDKLWLPKTGGRYLLTELSFPPRAIHHDFKDSCSGT